MSARTARRQGCGRTVVAVLAVVALLAAGCSPAKSRSPAAAPATSGSATSTTPTPPQANPATAPVDRSVRGHLVITLQGGNDLRLYLMRADGSGRRLLVNHPGLDLSPSWAPDGRRVAFRNNPNPDDDGSDIFVIKTDGTGARNLTHDAATGDGNWSPAWSPDGRWIAFASRRSGVLCLWAIRPDGGGLHQLTTRWGEYPAWSPDGSKLVYESRRDRNYEIYVVNADGSGDHRLTDTLQDDKGPKWSPDGTLIAFNSERDDSASSSSEGHGFAARSQLYLMRADGSGQTRLTHDQTDDNAPVWTPDGRISFIWDLCPTPDAQVCTQGVAVVDPGGGGLRRLPFPYGDYDWRG